MAHKVVHRLTKPDGNFNTIAEAIADLKSTIGEAPFKASKSSADDQSDGVVADLNRSSTFIAPNIIEFTDVWTSEAAKDAHYENRVKPAWQGAGITKDNWATTGKGWTRTIVSMEDV